MQSNNKGYTLIELLIAIAIIGILAATVSPNLSKMIKTQRLSSAAQTIHSTLLFAKSFALKNRQAVTVEFIPGIGTTGTCTVFRDTGTTNPNNYQFDTDETPLKSVSMPGDATLWKAELGSELNNLNGRKSIVFNSLGFPTLNAGGAPIFFNGDVYASIQIDPATTVYQRITISTGGGLKIEKSGDGANFY